MMHRHALFEFAGADAHKGHAVAVRGVHVGLYFENEAAEIRAVGLHKHIACHAGRGRGGEGEKFFKKGLHSEVVHGAAEEHGSELAVRDFIHIKVVACGVKKVDLLLKTVVIILAQLRGKGFVIYAAAYGIYLALAVIAAAEKLHGGALTVVNALEIAVGADGPVYGAGAYAEDIFYLLHEVEGVLAGAVHFVYEGKYRNTAQGAYLKELYGLLLNALGGIDEHDRAVGRHEGAVGILGEILVSGGVQNVYAVAFVVKGHDRAGDGYSALFFYFHPVADCMLFRAACLYGACHADGTAVKQQLFGESGFTGVRVRNDGKGAPSVYLLCKLRHGGSSDFKCLSNIKYYM